MKTPDGRARIGVRVLPLVSLLCSLFVPSILFAQVNHRPTISYVPDQRITSGSFAGQTVTVGDDITAVNSLVVTVSSSNSAWYAAANVVVSSTGSSRTITFNNTPATNGSTTITLTVTDGSNPTKSSATAFTLQRASSASGTVLQRIPNWTMPVNTGSPVLAYGPVTWMVMDDGNESGFSFSVASTNTTVMPAANVTFGGQNRGRTVTATPATNQSGRATITVTAADDTGNTTSTAFVVDVVSGNTAEPVISGLPTFARHNLPGSSTQVNFSVSDTQTSAANLRITASSSNQAIVADAGIVPGGSGGSRNVTITPTGTPGAAIITLNISDGGITRQSRFVFVAYDPSSAINEFARSNGVFILDGGGGTSYTTTFGLNVSLRDSAIRDSSDPNAANHVTGFTLRLFWNQIESSSTPGAYDFHIVENALSKMPSDQFLSLIIVPREPAYIAATARDAATYPNVADDPNVWVDGSDPVNDLRAVPWNAYLRERRLALIEALAAYEVDGIPLAVHPRLLVLDPYLPGGHSGIRDPNPPTQTLSHLGGNGGTTAEAKGYTRANLLAVVREDLIRFQDAFPGKVIQVGFWKVTDTENAAYGGLAAWEWIRQQLLAEFDDSDRPRVGFFMENLAGNRSVPEALPNGFPITSFGQALYDSRHDTWGSFQMLGSWTAPFNDGHVANTINGTPYDAIAYGFTTYNSRYTEVYVNDMDNAAFYPVLQGWHDLLATIAAPTGLAALPTSATTVSVQWNAVPGATSYTLQRRTVGGTFANVAGYSGTGTSFNDSGLSSNTEYHYRVRATTTHGNTAYCASFPATTLPPTVLLDDGFEVNFANWTDGGTTDWDRPTATVHSGSFSARAGPDDNDLISDNLDTSGASRITITFWYRDDDIDDDDDVYLQLYNGSTYNNRLELGRDAEDTWHQATVTLNNSGGDAQYFRSNFRIKFEATSLDTGENLWIDDVLVTIE
jgi:Fibronectin type III domain.